MIDGSPDQSVETLAEVLTTVRAMINPRNTEKGRTLKR